MQEKVVALREAMGQAKHSHEMTRTDDNQAELAR